MSPQIDLPPFDLITDLLYMFDHNFVNATMDLFMFIYYTCWIFLMHLDCILFFSKQLI